MTFNFKILATVGCTVLLAACSSGRSSYDHAGRAYWQRVEDTTALYMKGPKAQQILDENLASCVRQVDELVELGALRKVVPPDTHTEYLRALQASGDLEWYDTPTRYRHINVSHQDFQDFEGCMRHEGWERVRFVRYQTALKAERNYNFVRQIRSWGGLPGRDDTAAAEAAIKSEQNTPDILTGFAILPSQ